MSLDMFCSACGAALPHAAPITCPACSQTHWRDPKPCAGAVVTHNGKLLMVRRSHEPWSGYWDIPGGFLNCNEHPITTAEREVLEESGLEIRITGFLGMWLDEYGIGANQEITLNIYYHAVPTNGDTTNPDPAEVSEVTWFAPDSLPDKIAFPGHIAAVLRAWQKTYKLQQTVTPLPDRPK